jgi:hypothetical protein
VKTWKWSEFGIYITNQHWPPPKKLGREALYEPGKPKLTVKLINAERVNDNE